MAAQFFSLDIGTSLIKIVEMRLDNKSRRLLAAGMTPTPGKGFLSETDNDIKMLADAVHTLASQIGVSGDHIVASLPESQIFTRVIEMPVLTNSELQQAIKYESEQYIPIPLNEVKLDYQVLNRPQGQGNNKKMEVLLVAAPVILVNRYLKIIQTAGFKPLALDTEVTSTTRVFISAAQGVPTTLMIEIGASTTILSVVSAGKIAFTRSLAVGGLTFARAVAQDLGFDINQAEQYKNTYGLDDSLLDGKIAASIKSIFDVITTEVQRALAFWVGKHPEDVVKRFIVTGGSSKLVGVVPYLTQVTGLEGQVPNTWEGIDFAQSVNPRVKEDGPFYSIATGLALRDRND